MNYTPSQQTLITATAPLVVALAGPGAGKTTTLIARYAQHLGRCDVVVTFTNAAAAHLQAKMQAAGLPLPWFCGTLHGLALRTMANQIPCLTLLDEEQATELMETALTECKTKGSSTKALREIINGQRRPSQSEKVALMRYRAKLYEMRATDFDSLLSDFLEHVQKHAFTVNHLMVDEYQDSGTLDHAIYTAIRAEKFFVVGDINQSIYGFRGARLQNLAELADTAGAFVAFLEENFRCAHSICQAANKLISRNRERGDNLTKSATGEQGSIQANAFNSEGAEEAWICETAGHASRGRESVAVLCRYNHDRLRITKALETAGLQVAKTIVPDVPPDWKHALSMLALTANPIHPMHAFRFLCGLIGKPKAIEERAVAIANARTLYPFAAPDALPEAMEAAKLSREMRALLVAAWKGVGAPTYWKHHATQMALWLEESIAGAENKTPGIEVLTIHKAKGLEFDRVIVSGLEEGTLPGSDVEESRRLLYVAMTRARHHLTLTVCRQRMDQHRHQITNRTPSRFILEIQ